MVSLSVKSGGSMYRLRLLKNGLYQLHVKDGPAFEGTKEVIMRTAEDVGIVKAELYVAVEELIKNGHDYAEFGMLGTFIYTKLDRKRVT